MFFIIYYMCWVLPLFASRTYRGADNWENAINSCNLKIFNADNCNGEHSSKIWQPFVQIMTYPIITKGCHNLTSQIIKSSTVMEKNNITNCYHFCWFNQTNREANIKTLLMKGNSCSCLNKSLEDTIPQGDTSYTAVKCQGDNSSYAVYEIDVSYNFIANQTAGCGSVQPSEKIATFTNCSEKKGAYCTPLFNTDLIQLNQKEKMTWDDFKMKCEGRLASLNEIKNINSESSKTIFPSSRFWVGHRIWSYINYQFDPKLLTTSIKCGYYDSELGNAEFGSCLENYFYECHEKAKMLRATKSKRKSTSPYAASSPATSRLGRHRTSVAPSTLPPQSATTEQPPALLQGDPSALAQGNVLLQIRRNNFPPAVLVPSSLTSVQPLSASGTFSGSGNWENASNSCNLTIFNSDNSNEKYSSKIWQPFVQIMTLPLITKGCHMLTSQIIKSSTVIEKNNITNCYHFCWFNENNRETKIKTLLIKENNCSCLNKSLEDAIPQGDTFSTAVECPGDNNSYAVYEIDVSYDFTANQTAGCGSVQPSEKIATFTNCSEKKGAYCTPLSNSDPIRRNQKEKMTWDDFKMKCEGRLASLNEIKDTNINPDSPATIFPSSRFWVGHRIWSYINYQFDPELLTTSIKCGYYDPELGNVEFGSCLENNFYECHEKDAIWKTKGETTQEMQVPNQITNIVIGGIAGTVTVLLILLIIIYIKRKRARHIQPKPEPNEHQLIEKPKQPVYDETHLENDYDHLHEHQDTHNVGDVNVYDVSISCADVTNIGSDVYNTSKDFDCDKTYDYSTHNNLGKVDNSILNNDQYGTTPAGT